MTTSPSRALAFAALCILGVGLFGACAGDPTEDPTGSEPAETDPPGSATPTSVGGGTSTPTSPGGPTPSEPSEVTPTLPGGPTPTPAENRPPEVDIASPEDGASFEVGEAVPLRGSAVDPEEGTLPGSSLSWTSSLDGLLGTGGSLDPASLSEGVHLITLTALDRDGLSGRDTASITVVPVGTDQPPVAKILAPRDGASFTAGETIALEGQGTDPEDGALSGAALAWSSSRDGALGSGASLSVTLSVGAHTLSLTATDSFAQTGEARVSVVVNPDGLEAPTVTILAPRDGATLTGGEAVSLSGEAVSAHGVTLTGEALVWTSDQDGALGSGEAITADPLSAGPHRITLTATDADGAIGAASVGVRVLEASDNQPPVPTILSPADGASFPRGEVITFSGAATDPEDGPLSGSALSWSSSRDGALGQGASLSYAALSEGAHVITLTALDSEAALGQARVNLTITPAEVSNIPPTARLSGPAQVMATTQAHFDGSGSSDSDGEVVRYAFAVDGAAEQDGASSTFDHAFPEDGAHAVTLTVYDDDGASASQTLEVSVTPFVRQPHAALDSTWSLSTRCALDFLEDGRAVMATWESTHARAILVIQQPDGGFESEVVDGQGLDVGGAVYSGAVAINAGSGGVIHGAWLGERGGRWTLVYGRREGSGAWTLTEVGPALTVEDGRSLSLALDPSAGDRPVILFYGATTSTTSLARCEGDCADPEGWTIEAVWEETRAAAPRRAWPGDVEVGPDGTISTLVAYSYQTSTSSYQYKQGVLYRSRAPSGSWTEGVEIQAPVTGSSGPPLGALLTLDPSGQTFALTGKGLSHPVDGTDWRLSPLEASGLAYFDVVWSPELEAPAVGHRHSSSLELVRVNDAGYFIYERLGSQDSAWPGMAADPEGEARACFLRDGNLLLY